MTNITIKREGDTGKSTYGALYVNGKRVCYTLEDSCVHGTGPGCGIPAGKYPVVYTKSLSLGKRTLRLLGVPGRDGILIHSGNSSDDCRGCVLVGKQRITKDLIGASRTAVAMLERIVVPAIERKELVLMEVK